MREKGSWGIPPKKLTPTDDKAAHRQAFTPVEATMRSQKIEETKTRATT
jgi:hypothetical protein